MDMQVFLWRKTIFAPPLLTLNAGFATDVDFSWQKHSKTEANQV